MPDLFKGKPWELSNFPPPDRDEFMGWLGKHKWPRLEPIILQTIAHLRENGAEHIGIDLFISPFANIASYLP